jgi:HD-GYP domain-containing protein (c-di-GMP phosphodiesterase class II)
MKIKKHIVRILISIFGLFFVLAFLFTVSYEPIITSSLIDISGFSDQQDISFKTAGKERFFYEKTYSITDTEFSILNQNQDVGILVHRIPGYFYEVKFNGKTVGKVSDVYHKGSNIWNSAFVFIIDQDTIKADNHLTILGESASVFNENMFSVFLGRYDKVSKLLTTQRVLFQYYLLTSIGFLFALGIAITLVKASDTYGEGGYIWMAIGAILFGFYLIDYIEFWHLPISKLLFRKFTILMLFSGIGCLGVGLGKRFSRSLLKYFSAGLMVVGFILVFVAYSFPSFKLVYSYASIGLLIVQLLMVMTFIRIRNRIDFGWTLALVSLIMLSATIFDVYGMINNLGTAKMSIYSVVVMIVSTLTISLYHLSDDYLLVQKNAIQKEKAVSALMTHLYEDRLSGYKTFEYLEEQYTDNLNEIVSVAFVRIDAFDTIKSNKGIEVGEKVTHITYDIFDDVFESFGTIFVDGKGQVIIVLPGVHTEEAYKMLEVVRLKILQSEGIKDLCGYLPYTITSGLATRLNDEPILELTKRSNLAMLNGDGYGRNQTMIFQESFFEVSEKENNNVMLNFVYTIINTIDSRDRYTSRHSEEVSKYSVMIGEQLGFDIEQLNVLKIGSILHDCGKLGVSDFILNKEEALTEDEARIIRNHPVVGYQLAKQIFSDHRILGAIKYHHERIDGTGYPEGLSGVDIPFEAKIVSVADAYHAMTSSRKYGAILSHKDAFKELENGVGTQFDQTVVEAFRMCFE